MIHDASRQKQHYLSIQLSCITNNKLQTQNIKHLIITHNLEQTDLNLLHVYEGTSMDVVGFIINTNVFLTLHCVGLQRELNILQ